MTDTVECRDCGFAYADDGWCDCVVPNDVWAKISPTGDEGGLLCFTCMARRLVHKKLENVPLKVTSGPFSVTSLTEIPAEPLKWRSLSDSNFPEDEVDVLVIAPGEQAVAASLDHDDGTWQVAGGWELDWQPTHWAEMPYSVYKETSGE